MPMNRVQAESPASRGAVRVPAASGAGPAPRRRGWRRAWGLPVWAHLVALTLILLVLVPVVGRPQSFLADEGAAILQARSLATGQGWILEHPLPEVDPEGAWYPVVNAEHGEKGFAPLAKHPAYAVLTAAAARVAGVTGIVLLSLAGTVLSAGLAAALAGRFDSRFVRPALWAVGLGSPMLFDGYLAMGHTLGAASATAAVLAAVVALQERRPAVAVLVAPAVAVAVLLRSEALLFAAALALVATVLAVQRVHRRPALLMAGSVLAAAGAAHLLEQVWIARIAGEPVTALVPVPSSGADFLRGRVDGFLATWVNPAYGGSLNLRLALLLLIPAIAWCASRVRADPGDRAGILGGAAVAAAAALAAWTIDPTNVVPGLLVAFPLATAGLLVLRRRLFKDVGLAVVAATAGLFALAVLGTQYSEGGNAEWGGRYFALLVPAAIPVFLAALYAQGLALSVLVRRGAALALVVCSLALSAMAIGGLRASNKAGVEMAARVEAAGRATGDPRPVVLTTWGAGPRLLWPTFEDHRWLYARGPDLADAASRLRAAGIDRFVFVTRDLADDLPMLSGFSVLSTDGRSNGLREQVLVVGTVTG